MTGSSPSGQPHQGKRQQFMFKRHNLGMAERSHVRLHINDVRTMTLVSMQVISGGA
jgi:hypothetical protein